MGERPTRITTAVLVPRANWDGFEQRNLRLHVLQVVEAFAGLVARSYIRLGPSA